MTVAPVAAGPLTFEDRDGMCDDGRRHELVDGALVVTPAPGAAHQDCVLNLALFLKGTLDPDLKVMPSPFDWVAGADTVFQPDLLVARGATLARSAWSARPGWWSRCCRAAPVWWTSG